MKTTKKALSVLLAVIMIMSSMSVCFGTFGPVITVSAANGDGVQAFVDAAKTHGKNYGFKQFGYGAETTGSGNSKVITKTWTYKTGSYAEFKSLSNVITLMKTAAFNLDEYTKCKGHRSGSYCGDYWNKTCQENQCTDWVHVKNQLVALISVSDQKQLTNYGIDYLFDATFNRNEVYENTGDSDGGICVPSGNGQDNGTTTSASNLPNQMWNIVKIVPNDGAVQEIINGAATIAEIPDSIPTSFELKLGLARASQWKSEDCQSKTGDKYHLAIIEASAATEGPANKGSKTTNKSVLTAAQTTFSSAYFSTKNKNDVLAISSNTDTLNSVLSDIKSKKSNVDSTFGTDVYQKFFSTVPYAKTVKNIEDAITFLGFQTIVDKINELCEKDYSSYNSTQLAAHLAALEEAYSSYKGLNDEDKADILANYDFNPTEVDAKIAEINAAYTRLLVEEQLDTINNHLATYENKWTIEDVDDDRLAYNEAWAAYLIVEQDYNKLKTLDKAVIAEVAGADFFGRVEALYNHLAFLSTAANYNDQYTPKYREFYSSVKPNVPSQDTATLLSALKNYDTWYAELRNLIEGMAAGLSPEVAELLFDEVKDDMLNYMNNAYAVLNARVETQINIAYDLYTAHKDMYGPTVHYVSLESYQMVTAAIGNIEKEPYVFMKGTPNFNFSAETVAKYEELQDLLLAYDLFAESMGFDSFYQVKMADIEREDTIDDNFRQNTDKDDDGVGEYITSDAQIEKIIKLVDTALTDPNIAGALGLDLGTMLTDLVEGIIISDSFINTVVNLLYPLVLKEFGKVFANDLPKETSGCTVDYKYGLYDVFKDAGFNVYPDLLADQLAKTKNHQNNNAYAEVITMLDAAYSEAKTKYPGVGGKGNDAYSTTADPDNAGKLILDKTAWDSDALYEVVVDDNGDPVIDETTGLPKKQFALKWGIDAAKEAGMEGDELKAFFYEVFDDAVEGLKPLLLALIANKAWDAPQVNNIAQADHSIIGKAADVHLQLDATANSGYANLLVPVYEALGVAYTPVSKIEGDYLKDATKDVELIIGAILDPIFSLINKVGQAPLDTILGILPNLCYALEAGMVTPLLSMLKTTITYYAPLKLTTLASMCADAEAPSGGVAIDVGTMLDIPILDDINSDGLNALLSLIGIEGLPEINQALIACLGELTQIKTERKEAVYSSSKLASGKAYHVVANKADVLAYLAEYLLTAIGQPGVLDALMGLLGGSKEEAPAEGEESTTPEEGEATEEETSDLLTDILANLSTNPKAAIAAIVELLNFNEYETQMLYKWFNGTNYTAGTVEGFNPATEIYLNVNNDWTREKAEYLYTNLATIINAVIAMLPAKEEAAEGEDATETVAEGDTTEGTESEVEAAKTLSSMLDELIGGLFSDETLTSLAALLGKLDLNALIAGDKEEAPAEGEETPDAPETVAEGETATEEKEALDINALIKNLLGIDLGQFATLYGDIAEEVEATKDSEEKYVHDFGVNAATDKKAAFINELVAMLAPLNKVLDFLLADGDLTIFDGDAKVTLYGSDGYNTGLIPLLEALGCTPVAASTGSDALKATLNALVARIDALIANPVDSIFDLLDGLVYFLTSNGLSTAAQNLLKPALVLIETIRPIIDVMDIINNIEIGGNEEAAEGEDAPETVAEADKQTVGDLFGGELNLKVLDANFVVDLVSGLTKLNLSGLKSIFYDVAAALTAKTYTSASTLQTEWKTAEFNEEFDQADLLTVLLSFVVEWLGVEANATALDTLLKKEGIGAAIANIIKGAEITYETPNWMYFFDTEEEFLNAVANGMVIPSTLAALQYPNDWNKETAAYIAAELPELVDMIIGLINAEKTDDEGNALPTTLSALLTDLIGGVFSAKTLNDLIGMIAGLLENVADELLAAGGYLLNVDLVGLKGYTASEDIDTIDEFASELASVLTTYAPGIVELLFLGNDYRFFNKSDATDSIVISGGNGYAEGLALILEALGCENLPAADGETTAVVKGVFASLAARINAILANPVEEILELLPNLIFFLNANGAGVAIGNLLKPVNALLDSINALLEKPISIADLIKIKTTDEEGNEVELALDLENLALANVVEIVEAATKLDLTVVEDILVNFCVGKIVSYDSVSVNDAYKMTEFAKEDVITIILTIALIFVQNEDNAKALDELIGTEIISSIKTVFESAPVQYQLPAWYALDWDTVDYEKQTVGVVQSALTYPNDWTAEKSLYLADNLSAIVDTVIKMIEINGVKYNSLAALINANVNIYTPDLLETIQKALGDLLNGFEGDIKTIIDDYGFELVDGLLNADIKGLLDYDVSRVNDKASFVAALTGMLMEVEGIVEWLLLGEDYAFFVDTDGNDIITLNGAEGYAQGLSLILEALGVENLPAADGKTEEIVAGVLTAVFDRVDEILANPVDEVIDILPNVIYFINANGLAAAVNNLAGAFNALALKLKTFGLNITLEDLLNIEKLLKITDEEGNVKDLAIGLDNLTLAAVIEVVEEMTGLDLAGVADIFVNFALGKVQGYTGINGELNAMMVYDEGEAGRFNKGDMITLVVTAAMLVLNAEGNAAKLDEMLKTNGIVEAILNVIEGSEIVYTAPNWNYPLAENGTVDAMKYSITYPNNWTEATAEAVTEFLLSDDFDALIAGLIEGGKYASLSDLLNAKVNVFTSENLQAIVDLIANLLKDIDDGLLEAAGVLLGADIVGLKAYKAPGGITTVDAFAEELANILNTYAKGVVEWLLLGKDYKFFVKEDANKLPVDAVVISGAKGYAEGLALLLEALGCEDLPATGTTEEIVTGVLKSLANRINEIFADPVNEVVDLLPNLLYFLNTNGVAAVIDNTTAALTALLGKLSAFGLNLDINELVNLKKLMKIEDTDATISLDNLSMADILQAVSYMIDGLNLTYIKDILVGFALGQVNEYDSVSANAAYKMTYKDEFDKHDMVTVLANIVLITIEDKSNEAFLVDLMGNDIYEVVIDVLNLTEAKAPVQYMQWKDTDKVGNIYNSLKTSPTYKEFQYGPNYTEEMAQYIADNIGEFINNIIYLLGLNINGVPANSLEDLLAALLGGSLYNSDLVITIRDALAGLAGSIEGLEVNGKNVGKLIVKVLAAAEIADLKAIGKVNVPAFEDNKAMFVESICDVLEPAYGLLTWLLADEELAFFVDLEKNDFITLPGAEGYRNGIALLLEAIGCENLPAELNGEGDALVKAILNPLLARIDEILANPAEEILAVLSNVMYFINSKGVDVVIKNTLNAVYTVLGAIEPIAKVDLYELVGLTPYVDLTAEELIDMLLNKLEIAGFDFTAISVDMFSELTVGELTTYTSIADQNEAGSKTAYKMVYNSQYADEADMVTAVLRLVITFILTEDNRNVLVDLLKSELGMSADAEKYVRALLNSFGDCVVGKEGEDLRLGMDTVLATIYYVFYGLDISVDEMVAGKKDLDKAWKEKLEELNKDAATDDTKVGDLLTDIFDIMFNDKGEDGKYPEGNDVIDQNGVASNGFLSFFARIKAFFQEIADFFRNLFSFGK